MNSESVVKSPLPFYNELNNLLEYFIPPRCCDEFLIHLNFSHVECLKILLSKALGYGIIFASIMVKLPQVIKIYRAGSSKGISFYGQLFELMAVTSMMVYSIYMRYPFSAYGESVFLSIQTSAIAFFTLYYGGKRQYSILFLALYGAITAFLSTPLVPFALLQALQTLSTPFSAIGKLLQVVANFRQGHTGQLSVVTVFLLTGGCYARIFTSFQETGDRLLIFNFVVSSAINTILLLQIFYYWNVKSVSTSSNIQAKKKAKKIN